MEQWWNDTHGDEFRVSTTLSTATDVQIGLGSNVGPYNERPLPNDLNYGTACYRQSND
jgi:hypothetical protein